MNVGNSCVTLLLMYASPGKSRHHSSMLMPAFEWQAMTSY